MYKLGLLTILPTPNTKQTPNRKKLTIAAVRNRRSNRRMPHKRMLVFTGVV